METHSRRGLKETQSHDSWIRPDLSRAHRAESGKEGEQDRKTRWGRGCRFEGGESVKIEMLLFLAPGRLDPLRLDNEVIRLILRTIKTYRPLHRCVRLVDVQIPGGGNDHFRLLRLEQLGPETLDILLPQLGYLGGTLSPFRALLGERGNRGDG